MQSLKELKGLVIAKANNSDNVQGFADTEREAIGIVLFLTEGDVDVWLYHNTDDQEPYKIVQVRG